MATHVITIPYTYLAEVVDPDHPRRKGRRDVVVGTVDAMVPSLATRDAPAAFAQVPAPGDDAVSYRTYEGRLYAPRREEHRSMVATPGRFRDPEGNRETALVRAVRDPSEFLVVDGVEYVRTRPILRVDPTAGTVAFRADADATERGHFFSPLRPEAAMAFARRLEGMGYGPFAADGDLPTLVGTVDVDVMTSEAANVAGAVARDVSIRDNGHLMPEDAAREHADLMGTRTRFLSEDPIPVDDCLAYVATYRRLLAALRAAPDDPRCAAFLDKTRPTAERLAFEDEACPAWAPMDEEDAAALRF